MRSNLRKKCSILGTIENDIPWEVKDKHMLLKVLDTVYSVYVLAIKR